VFSVDAAFGTTAGETPRERAKAFLSRNPPLIAAALALVAPDALAPDVLVDASRILVFALLPLGFLAVGITLAHEAEEGAVRLPPPLTRRLGAALVLRLIVAPALLLVIAAPFIDLPDAYLLLAAMPTGLNGMVVAHAYGLDVGYAAAAVAWSTSIVLAIGLVATAVV
jgi:predicted permease